MKTLLFTFLVVLLSTAGSVPMAAQEPYAMFTEADSTLTFYYDTQRATRSGTPYVMPTKWNDPAWAGTWDSPQAGIRHAVFDASFAGYRPTTLMSWFRYLGSLQDIKGLQNLNTERVTSMLGMFYCCESLTSLDLSHFNTAKVTNMSCLFVDCKSLTSIDLSHFNTAKVTNMRFMFAGCESLTSLDLSHFNTANVADMVSMFADCKSLTSLDLSHFNTAKVTEMYSMFRGCKSLTSLDLSHFNTRKVTDMSCMFQNCQSLLSLDLSSFITRNVTNMGYMFCGNVSLTSIYCNDDWSKGKVEEDGDMFTGCTNLQGTRAEYDDTKTGIEMANPTTGYFAPADCDCR